MGDNLLFKDVNLIPKFIWNLKHSNKSLQLAGTEQISKLYKTNKGQ